ncbi:MAG: hypothetical protein H6581_21160 [Bacteroidia bacterium]|nr:hypothetical protein [Bacteroidia bacterium]
MIDLKVFLEKIDQKGEDSHPIILHFRDGSGLVVVFDGMGGAGSQQYELGGKQFSGAWFASRIMKAVVAAWFKQKKARKEPYDVIANLKDLEEVMNIVLKHTAKKLDTNESRLKSNLHKRFPTTLTGIYYEPNDSNGFRATAINAGDSRSYVLRPKEGLQQVSVDDLTGGGDAFQNLYGDSKISNCINADSGFQLNTYPFSVDSPVIFLSATDGCFDYVPFPAHWEYMVVDSLMDNNSLDAWQQDLTNRLREIASDDTALGLSAHGWKNFEELKKAFASRHVYLKETFISPMDDYEKRLQVVEEDKKGELLKERHSLRKQLWTIYGPGYEGLMKKPELNQA